MDARELKRRYMEKWRRSNARELYVLYGLRAFLPEPFKVRLTGLGAGSDSYIERSYQGLEEAFDITVYYDGRPCCFVDVTGVESVSDVRMHSCRGYCVGSWKLAKARKLGVVEAVWVALVVEEDWRVLWLPLRLLDAWESGDAPWLSRCRLYEDERESLCLESSRWKRFKHFKQWLLSYAPYHARRISELQARARG